MKVTQEMADHVQTYIDYVRSIGGDQKYEQKVRYDNYVPDGFGTADVLIDKWPTLYVIDLKYGKGLRVDAEKNPQGMLYALGALREAELFNEFENVVIVIHQPRLNHVSEWETTPAELREFGEYAEERAMVALSDDAPRVPGKKQCQWCKAKATCPELSKKAEVVLLTEFDSIGGRGLPDPKVLSDSQLRAIIDNKSLIESMLKAVDAHVKAIIESGKNFPGYKVVPGRSSRKWSDEAKAERLLRRLLGAKNAYTKKLLTAPAAEKVLGKEDKHRIEKLIVKPEGAPTLAPESDKRTAINYTPITADEFDQLEDRTVKN